MGGWGPEPIWSVAKVLENTPACTSGKSVSIVVEVDSETASQYKIPGQYVQVRLNNETKPLFLAIASAPNDGANDANDNTRFEFLIKKTQGNEWATSLSGTSTSGASSSIEISQVLGEGFRVEENFNGFKYDFPTQNILLFATGSGIAPIKAAMETNGFLNVGDTTDGGTGRTCRLYYGEKTRDDVCFTSLFNEWERNGYEVVPVLSQQSEEDTTGISAGRCGYVQNALEEDGVPIPRNSGALLCGQAKMAESVGEILTKAGVFEGRILTNF
jgi:NAD(P)H-flavin reductase